MQFCSARYGFFGLLALLAVALLGGCEQGPPSPWKEMRFPLTNGEVLPGADADRLVVVYRKVSDFEGLVREYSSALERAGFAFDKHGKSHDPSVATHSAIFSKGEQRLLLTVVKDNRITVTINKLLD